jgi:putative pyruvate formate lyase activating enzyme
MCRTGMNPVVSSFNAHFGEESCLVGRKGSGTIFFANCNLSCVFCQNYDISHLGRGEEISFRELSDIMLLLQSRGCHNINFVTPTHMVSAIVTALSDAVPRGLTVPLVYNSGGYDSTDTLRMLSGVFDIYMPDLKFMDSGTAGTLCGAQDYPERAADAVREMHDQVGDLVIDERGIAVKGLLVRHLVLPNNLAGTDGVISFIAGLSKNTYLNLMDQYRPEHRAGECFDLKRRVTLQEFDDAVRAALDAGIKRIDCLNR